MPAGTYKIIFNVNNVEYIKCFVIFSGVDLGYTTTYANNITGTIYLSFLNDESGKTNFYTFGNRSIRFYFDNYSSVVSYKTSRMDSYKSISSPASSIKYATGSISASFTNNSDNVLIENISFKTINEKEINYNIYCYPESFKNFTTPVFVNYICDDAKIDAIDYFMIDTSQIQEFYDNIKLPKPKKEHCLFAGWYGDKELQEELPSQNDDWYLKNLDFLNIGNNYKIKNFAETPEKYCKSIFLYAKFQYLADISSSNVSIETSLLNDNFTYDGTEKSLTQISLTYTTENYSLQKDVDYSIEYSNNINAGTAKCKLTGLGRFFGEVEIEFIIKKASNSIDLTTFDWIYGDAPSIPIVLRKFGNVLITYGLTADGEFFEQAPENVGHYFMKAEIQENANYEGACQIKTFDILKAQNTIKILIQNWTYGESLNTPIVKTKFGEAIVKYSDEENGIFNDEIPTNAGNYYVKAEVVGTDNYTACYVVESFVIQKRSNVIQIAIENWNYGDTNFSPTVKCEFGEASLSYSTERNGTYKKNMPENVGQYFVKAETPESDNYYQTVIIETFKINKSINDIQLLIENWTYGDDPKLPNVSAKFGNPIVTYAQYDMPIYSTHMPINSGKYYIRAAVPATNNYFGATIIEEFEIYKAQNNVNISLMDWAYGENPNIPKIEKNFGEASITFSATEDGIYTPQVPSNAGSYYVKAEIQESQNYFGASSTCPFKIQKSENQLQMQPVNWTYGQNPCLPITNCKFGSVSFSYSSSLNGQFFDTVPQKAGVYYVKGEITETTNYYGATQVKPFKIMMLEIDTSAIEFKSQTFVYDGSPKSLFVSGSLLPEIAIEIENNNQTEIGTYLVTAKFIINENIKEIAPLNAVLTINKPELVAKDELGNIEITLQNENGFAPNAELKITNLDKNYANVNNLIENGKYVEHFIELNVVNNDQDPNCLKTSKIFIASPLLQNRNLTISTARNNNINNVEYKINNNYIELESTDLSNIIIAAPKGINIALIVGLSSGTVLIAGGIIISIFIIKRKKTI